MTYSGSRGSSSGSPNSYFRQVPNLDYPSLSNDRNSVYDYELVKNIFKRVVMRDDIFNDITTFTKYSVQGDERPDQVASRFYNDKNYWWIIARANNQSDSVFMVPGKEYRIPQNLSLIIQEYEELNR